MYILNVFLLVSVVILFICTLYRTLYRSVIVENLDNIPEMIYLPINAYIIGDMDMTVQGEDIQNWIDTKDIQDIFNEVNTEFFNKIGIQWVIMNNIDKYDAPDDAQLDYISELTRDTDIYPNTDRMAAYTSLIPEGKYSSDFNNIYFTTFQGNTRQGNANVNKTNKTIDVNDDIHFTMIGTNSNKQTKNIPEIRKLQHSDGEPSLVFTVAHELAHVLGLNHLESNVENIMNATTSSLKYTETQENTMINNANIFSNIYKTREISTGPALGGGESGSDGDDESDGESGGESGSESGGESGSDGNDESGSDVVEPGRGDYEYDEVAPVSRAGNQYEKNGSPNTGKLNDWVRGKYNVLTPHKADHVNTSNIQVRQGRVYQGTLVSQKIFNQELTPEPYKYGSTSSVYIPKLLV